MMMGQATEFQWVLHMPKVVFALDTMESTAEVGRKLGSALVATDSTAKVQNLGESWGMCSKHCYTNRSAVPAEL